MLNIGIDIAKRSHTAGAVDGDGKVAIESFQFNNTADGFAKLLARLAKAGAEPEDALIGMEATGHTGSPCSISSARTAGRRPS